MVSRDDGRECDPLVRSVAFPLGRLCMTPGVKEEVPPSELLHALRRHANKDWGEIDPGDVGLNDRALIEGTRLFSVYVTKSGTKFWVITEADRASTTALLPEEY